MWILFAFGSAIFAGITAILAKCGIKNTDSNLATAIRTLIVLIFAWLMVFITGAHKMIGNIGAKTLLFLILSGLSTGASWLCYFKAMKLGDVNKVAPIDKSSVVLTVLLAFIILGEPVTAFSLIGIVAIGLGTLLMIQRKQTEEKATSRRWLIYAILSAVFAALTSILGKIGIQGVDSNLGTAIRTIVVLIAAWTVVFITKKQGDIAKLDKQSWIFLCLSGIATGASWLCYYRALQDGPASIVVPIDKLSIVLTIAFSCIFLKEKLTRNALIGLALIVAGTLVMLI
ncbi:MAG: EamA family transporter [Clostridia bacterium]